MIEGKPKKYHSGNRASAVKKESSSPGENRSVGEAAARWQKLAESEKSVYTEVDMPLARVASMAGSGYVEPVVAATDDRSWVLEAGCGSGAVSLALAHRGRRVVGLDISPRVLANLRRNRERLRGESGADFFVLPLRGDLERLPFADGVFAAATNEGVVEHWLDPRARRAVLVEMARVVKPGGMVAVYVPNGRHPLVRWWEWMRYPGYVKSEGVPWHRYGWRGLADDLAAAGLKDVVADGLSPYSTLAVWPNWWILRAVAALLRRLLPEPRWLRRRCGFNLVAWGKVDRHGGKDSNGS